MSVVNCEDCMYTTRCYKNKDVIDCYDVYKSEICYESVNISDSYGIFFSSFIKNCSDMFFCSDCIGCQNCIGCTNLRNKKYYVFNKDVRKQKYEWYLKQTFENPDSLKKVENAIKNFRSNQIVRNIHLVSCENCSGDFVDNSKNCFHCFYTKDSEDCAYCNFTSNLKDSIDSDFTDSTPFSLNCMAMEQCYETIFCNLCVNSSTVFYSNLLVGCKNCFGCSSLKSKQYCILNKQYSKENYEKLMNLIIEHMKKTGEWGNFFPNKMTAFSYNETVAMEHYPLNREKALKSGHKWKEKNPQEYKPQNITIPKNIDDVNNTITDEILACSECGKNYKILQLELRFYKKHRIPIPINCPECRHINRLKLRNPRNFFNTNCRKCNKSIKTTFSPDRPEIIYCEECYKKEVY